MLDQYTERVPIQNKERYEQVQNQLLNNGYCWIDGCKEFYDLFSCIPFYCIDFVIHHHQKTFEWRFPENND